MDQATLQLLARIKIRLRQEKGIVLNTQRFFVEPEYTEQVLDSAEESEDIELVTTSLEIRSRLGWIDPDTSHLPQQDTPARGAGSPRRSGAAVLAGRCIFGARG